jgi:hypothetical protein
LFESYEAVVVEDHDFIDPIITNFVGITDDTAFGISELESNIFHITKIQTDKRNKRVLIKTMKLTVSPV